MAAACVSIQQLESFTSGLLDDGTGSRIREHLSSCDECRKRLEELKTRALPSFDADATADAQITIVSPPRSRRVGDSKPEQHYPKIEGYHITGVLGQGGMGIVYRATQARLNRMVALKVLPAIVGSANPAAVKRFRREATAAARLHHTNIIPIYDFGESRDAHYYAMELVIGQPLNVLIQSFASQDASQANSFKFAEMIRSHIADAQEASSQTLGSQVSVEDSSGGMSVPGTPGRGRTYFQFVARWMTEAADALHYAHSQGVIHRDIKPANLILSSDGRIMIADFGLAKTEDEESVTISGAFLGTLRYVSPEQSMAKRGNVDNRTDIYSLGATMYELLCFQPAFPGVDQKAILGAILSRDPTSPRKINPAVPPELETICLKSMEKSPDARYLTARDLADDLRRYANDLPIVAKRPSIVVRAAKFVRRHRAAVTAVTAVVLVAAAVGITLREQSRRREADRQRREADVESYYERGVSLAKDHHWNAAKTQFSRALAIAPDHPTPLLGISWMQLEHVKDLSGAEKLAALNEVDGLCRRLLAKDPNDINALNYRAVALRRLGHYPEAIEALQKIAKAQPDYFAGWSNLGTGYAMKGDMKEAEDCLKKGMELAQHGTERLADRANTFRNLASFELFMRKPAAAEHLANAVKRNPYDVPSWVLMARMKLELTGFINPPDALDDAKHADRLAVGKDSDAKHADELAEGRDVHAKRLLALAYLANKEFNAAVTQAEAAMKLQDFSTIDHLIIARAQAELGQLDAARAALTEARANWPDDLQSAGQYRVTADDGVLWFDTADEWLGLRAAIERLLQPPP
ncbi:MAG: protein kinase [Planctomycetes bacterium]|nr:protein kinase [Planctomycetota bacterium]MBI3833782.1 protein kinase [Planctomycetota bacterium]